jgi:L-rhamnose isomerase
MKDMPADRLRYRRLLRDSLDEILAEQYPAEYLVDAVECKLFGVGVESYTVGSHEFYMGYVAHARANGCDHLMLTLDMGHFHPTETIADRSRHCSCSIQSFWSMSAAASSGTATMLSFRMRMSLT